ncbi:MAG: hypothetical protein EWM73_03740 [Nitrospira sp.]|nr:MAG: hypothetical protein EWM73_03740 [Nitrospira sp.]
MAQEPGVLGDDAQLPAFVAEAIEFDVAYHNRFVRGSTQTVQLLFEPFQFSARFFFLCLGIGELGTKDVSGSGEFFLLTCRLRDGGPRDSEIFLQGLCTGLAQDQGFAHGDGFLLQFEHVLL